MNGNVMGNLPDRRIGDPGNPIVIADGYWRHIRHIRVYHRRYPEVRGEGRTLAEAAGHLMNQLTRGLDFAHGRDRETAERAVAEVRAIRSPWPGQRQRSRTPPRSHDTVAASVSATLRPINLGENIMSTMTHDKSWRRGNADLLPPHIVALIRERQRRLAAVSRYDRYIAEASGHLTLQGFWPASGGRIRRTHSG